MSKNESQADRAKRIAEGVAALADIKAKRKADAARGKNATHTPGPWTVDIVKDGGNWTYNIRTVQPHNPAGGLGKHIAQVNGAMQARGEDNAALIAAAPDLLAACEAASGFVEAHALALGDAGKVGASQAALVAYDQLRSAIAAARGGKGGGM